MTTEGQIEDALIAALGDLKYTHRPDIRDRTALEAFVDEVLRRRIFDSELLREPMAPLNLDWKARTQAELVLVVEPTPLLRKPAQRREISGLSAYEEGQ